MTKPFLDLWFYFSWNDPNPVPITAQCDTLSVTWVGGRGSLVSGRKPPTGGDSVAPYSLAIHSSISQAPIVLSAGSGLTGNFLIPFPNGTQYQICMYDTNGNSGGCQDIYTVYSSSANCTAYPDVPNPLNIQTTTSRYDWIPQCDNITLSLADGQAPYTFSAQQALGPPVNVTGITGSSFQWKNIFPWTTPFFISVSDSTGRAWSLGPLHSDDGSSNCITSGNASKSTFSSPGPLAGLAVAMVAAGALLALLVVYLISRKRSRKRGNQVQAANPMEHPSQNQSTLHPQVAMHQTGSSHPSAGHLTAYDLETRDGTASLRPSQSPSRRFSFQSSTVESAPVTSRSNGGRRVLSSQGGRGTDTIYSADSVVVELPPQYQDRSPRVLSPPPEIRDNASRNNPVIDGRNRVSVEPPLSPMSSASESGPSAPLLSSPAQGTGVAARRRLPAIPQQSPTAADND